MLLSTVLLVAAAHTTLALPGSSTKTAAPTSCTSTYECATGTVTAIQTASECPTLTACPPIPRCILKTTKTILDIPTDPCCAPASTVTVLSACPSCLEGCSTKTEMVYYNTFPVPATMTTMQYQRPTYATPTPYTPPPPNTAPMPTQQPVFRLDPMPMSMDCPRTVYVKEKWNMGPTKTEYLRSEVSTTSTDCGECGELVTRGVLGKGPMVRFEGTVTESWEVETRTVWVCRESEGVEKYF